MRDPDCSEGKRIAELHEKIRLLQDSILEEKLLCPDFFAFTLKSIADIRKELTLLGKRVKNLEKRRVKR